jgi:hypothetical protein
MKRTVCVLYKYAEAHRFFSLLTGLAAVIGTPIVLLYVLPLGMVAHRDILLVLGKIYDIHDKFAACVAQESGTDTISSYHISLDAGNFSFFFQSC